MLYSCPDTFLSMQALQQLSGDALYGQGHNSELEWDLVVPRRTL